MAGRAIHPDVWKRFFALVQQGMSVSAAAREVGVDRSTAVRKMNMTIKGDGRLAAQLGREEKLGEPRAADDPSLSEEARHCVDCFECFRLRYFGHVSTPWQVDAAYRMVGLLGSPHKEHVVVNVPPGAGKSTTFTHDIVAWMIVRDRSVRVLIGSRTERQARWYVGRLKTTLERVDCVRASDNDRRKGLAVDAVATLTADYGRFKPTNPDVWRSEEFTVAQVGNIASSDKERTVSAYGMDGGFLGGRYDVVVWDDLVDKTSLRTADARERLINMWEMEAETRLEPGGLLILQGQRLRSDDLYRFALDMRVATDEDVDESDVESLPRKYHHIIYRAHFEDICKGRHKDNPDHARSGTPWKPDGSGGCLLDPVRLDWRTLHTLELHKNERFAVMYQQDDLDLAGGLVQPVWVSGGLGDDGVEYLGCWDSDRGLAQLPKGLSGFVSVATADPSPTKYWAVEWWLYHPASEQRFLMDLERAVMDAPDFLDWNYAEGEFTGVMEEWQLRSQDMGVPITHWIFEVNAAQKFVLQYDHAKRWQRKHGVHVIPHYTHRNKADDERGVETIAPHWRHGRVRLPGRQGNPGRVAAMKLVDEAVRWGQGGTTDCIMAQWFFEYNLPNIYSPQVAAPQFKRPGWATGDKPKSLLRAV